MSSRFPLRRGTLIRPGRGIRLQFLFPSFSPPPFLSLVKGVFCSIVVVVCAGVKLVLLRYLRHINRMDTVGSGRNVPLLSSISPSSAAPNVTVCSSGAVIVHQYQTVNHINHSGSLLLLLCVSVHSALTVSMTPSVKPLHHGTTDDTRKRTRTHTHTVCSSEL